MDNRLLTIRNEFSAWARQAGQRTQRANRGELAAVDLPVEFPTITEPRGLPDTWGVLGEVDGHFIVTAPTGWLLVTQDSYRDSNDGLVRRVRVLTAYPTLGHMAANLLDNKYRYNFDQTAAVVTFNGLFTQLFTEDEYPTSEQLLAALGSLTVPAAAYDPALHERLPQRSPQRDIVEEALLTNLTAHPLPGPDGTTM